LNNIKFEKDEITGFSRELVFDDDGMVAYGYFNEDSN
jgi:hypothetical protein